MKQGFGCGAVLAALLVLAGCQAPASGSASQTAPMELKIYTVPPAQTGRLAEAVGNALGGKASVTTPVSGKLLVYAPRDTQASIDAALASLGQASPAQAAVAQVSLHFWVVDAQAGAGTDDVALKPLSATLDALRQHMGPLHFQVNQAASAAVASDHHGTITTTAPDGYPRTFDFRVAAASGDAIDLSLDYQDAGHSGLRQVNTEVGTRYGEYLVLAQAPGVCPGSVAQATPATACADAPALRLLIVRADRLNARS